MHQIAVNVMPGFSIIRRCIFTLDPVGHVGGLVTLQGRTSASLKDNALLAPGLSEELAYGANADLSLADRQCDVECNIAGPTARAVELWERIVERRFVPPYE